MESFHGQAIPPEWDELDDTEMGEAPPEPLVGTECRDKEPPKMSDRDRFDSKKSRQGFRYGPGGPGQQYRYFVPSVVHDSQAQASREEAKLAFHQYDSSWRVIRPHDADHPVPGLRDVRMRDGVAYGWMSATGAAKEQLIKRGTMAFYTGGFGIKAETNCRSGVMIHPFQEVSNVEKLAKFLRRTELPRWHPDRLNLRTGEPGVINEAIGVTDDVVAIRTAIQQLIDACEKFLENGI